MKSISKDDVASIVAVVGREGAISALSNSRQINNQNLAELANSLGLKVSGKETKGNVASQIVRYVDRRISKPLEELKTMSKDELILYFEQVECDQDELVELLSSIDLRLRPKSRRAILEFTAIQISSLGIFERVADGHS